MNSDKLKRIVIVLLLFETSIAVAYAKVQTGDYENLMKWHRHPKYGLLPLLGVFSDSIYTPQDIVNGNLPIPTPDTETTLYSVYPFFNQKGIIGVSYPIYSSRGHSKSVTLDFRYKPENCGYGCVRLYTIGDGERMTEIDSIPLSMSDKWTKIHKKVFLHTPCALHVELEVAGDTILEGNLDRLLIDKFLISSGGKSLKKTSEGQLTTPIKPSDVHSMESLMTQPILDKKILGLGETTHGTVTLQDIAFDIMKERILHHSCTLILFEMPLEMFLSINRYVKNDERFHLEDIKKMLGDDLYSESTVSFLQWVKEYNRSHNNVVTVLGMDWHYSHYDTRMRLDDFIDKLDSTNSGIWNSLCRTILLEEDGAPLAKFDADDSIKDALTTEETALLRHCIENLIQEDKTVRIATRDENMPMRIKMMMDLYKPETVTIHAHLGHLNYISNTVLPWLMTDCPSTGYALKQTFYDDYACIALTSAFGNTYDWTKNHVIPLEEPPLMSLEQILSTLDVDSVYLPIDGMRDTHWCKIRCIGSNGSDADCQFVDIAPSARFDGIIIVKETLPIPSRIHTNGEIKKSFLRRYVDAVSKNLSEQKAIQQQDNTEDLVAVNKKNDTVADSDSIYFACDEMPEMHGGTSAMMDYLQRNIRYPQEALDAKKEGVVLVHFIVEKDGSISNPEVKMSVDPSLDAEAVRVITSMPKWKPGKQDGKPVRVYYNIPVRFILNAPQSAPDAQAPGYRA